MSRFCCGVLVADTGTGGSRPEMLGPENDPRRDIEGAGCGVALLSFRSDVTEDPREDVR